MAGQLRKLRHVYLAYCLAGSRLQSVIDAVHVPLVDLSPAQRQASDGRELAQQLKDDGYEAFR
jgi:hypothetical protein